VVEPLFAAGDYTLALKQLAALRESVDGFFDSVMVNCEDEKQRLNRLALLNSLSNLFLSTADLSRLQ
jgi:glycyl-tRNA synthetase beta chain